MMQESTQKRARLSAYQSLQCFFVKEIPALKKSLRSAAKVQMNLPRFPRYI
jgi:hypothetical protein